MVEVVRRHAERVVEAHPLRAADALQIAAALVAAEEDPGSLPFVTLDRNLAEAAEREGFRVYLPSESLSTLNHRILYNSPDGSL